MATVFVVAITSVITIGWAAFNARAASRPGRGYADSLLLMTIAAVSLIVVWIVATNVAKAAAGWTPLVAIQVLVANAPLIKGSRRRRVS